MKRLTSQSVEKLVRSRGLKMTPQRQVIVEYLQGATHHPTAEEILGAVNRKFPMTSRATVYNTLNWLKEEGMVSEVFENGVARFDPNTAQHHHFVCRLCEQVQDIDWEAIGALPQCTLPDRHTIENYEITLRGVCARCANQKT